MLFDPSPSLFHSVQMSWSMMVGLKFKQTLRLAMLSMSRSPKFLKIHDTSCPRVQDRRTKTASGTRKLTETLPSMVISQPISSWPISLYQTPTRFPVNLIRAKKHMDDVQIPRKESLQNAEISRRKEDWIEKAGIGQYFECSIWYESRGGRPCHRPRSWSPVRKRGKQELQLRESKRRKNSHGNQFDLIC